MKPAATARVLKKVEIVTEITGFHLQRAKRRIGITVFRLFLGQVKADLGSERRITGYLRPSIFASVFIRVGN